MAGNLSGFLWPGRQPWTTNPPKNSPNSGELGALEFEPSDCPICGEHEIGREFRKTVHGIPLRFGICLYCGTLYADPRLTVDSLNALYGAEEFFEGRQNTLNYYSFLSGEEYLRRTARGRIKRLAEHTSGRRLLEVASAAGFFLVEAKDAGFQVEGVEISRPMAEFAANRWGVPVTAWVYRRDPFGHRAIRRDRLVGGHDDSPRPSSNHGQIPRRAEAWWRLGLQHL